MKWERPNPPRLNDTEAIVRGGVSPRTYKGRGPGGSIVGAIMELPITAEVTFNGRSSTKFASRPNAGSEDVTEACTQIPKGC